MMTKPEPSLESASSSIPTGSGRSPLYESTSFHQKLVDKLRTFYVYGQTGRLTLTRRHGASSARLFFVDGTLVHLESTDPDCGTAPEEIDRTILKLLTWKNAEMEWVPDIFPETRTLANELSVLFRKIEKIEQSKRTQSWGSGTCRLMVAPGEGNSRLPLILNVITDSGQEHEFILLSERTVIGRDAGMADMVVPEATISRKHALLQIIESGTFIQDLGTRNGIYINGYRIDPHVFYPIAESDSVHLSNHRLMLQPESGIVSEVMQAKARHQLRRLKRHMQKWDSDQEDTPSAPFPANPELDETAAIPE